MIWPSKCRHLNGLVASMALASFRRDDHRPYPARPLFATEPKLKLGWSPQQISGRLKKESNHGVRPKREYINHESIYPFLYDPAQKDQKLWAYLPRGHRKRRHWLGRRSKSVQIPTG